MGFGGSQLFLDRARLYDRAGDLDLALADVDRAEQLGGPFDRSLGRERGDMLWKHGRRDDAISVYREEMADRKTRGGLWEIMGFTLAHRLVEMGRTDQAIEVLEQILESARARTSAEQELKRLRGNSYDN